MPYPIDKKLVVGISSSALFDLSESDKIFREQGEEKYLEFQKNNELIPLKKGAGFPFIKKLLSINTSLGLSEKPIEVILLSKNSPETGLRAFNSIEHYNLDISRGAFLSGECPSKYIPSFNIKLFLSENDEDIKIANKLQYPGGKINKSFFEEDKDDKKLRIAFDFDGVIVDDESEQVFQQSGKSVAEFLRYEIENQYIAHNPGPLKIFLEAISEIQKQEKLKKKRDSSYSPMIETSIVTARNAPAHKRAICSLLQFGINIDKIFFIKWNRSRRNNY
jgi:5'-nucleotidase